MKGYHDSVPPPGYGQEQPSAPPGPGIYPSIQQQQHQQVPMVVYNNHTIASTNFGPYPMRYTCPRCNKDVMTKTESTVGLMTYLASGLLFCLGACLCCCLIPCCCKSCKDVEHKCPECDHQLGLFKRLISGEPSQPRVILLRILPTLSGDNRIQFCPHVAAYQSRSNNNTV